MFMNTETGASEPKTLDAVAGSTTHHNNAKNRFDKLIEEATFELKIYIEREDESATVWLT